MLDFIEPYSLDLWLKWPVVPLVQNKKKNSCLHCILLFFSMKTITYLFIDLIFLGLAIECSDIEHGIQLLLKDTK